MSHLYGMYLVLIFTRNQFLIAVLLLVQMPVFWETATDVDCYYIFLSVTHVVNILTISIRVCADKSLARPGRKQATATKLGIYSTPPPLSSIHFLARCSISCKSLKKKNQNVRPTRSSRQQWPPRRTKNGDLSIVFFRSREQVVVRRGKIRRMGWVMKALEAQTCSLAHEQTPLSKDTIVFILRHREVSRAKGFINTTLYETCSVQFTVCFFTLCWIVA